jgi:hypothetical protein
VALVARHGTDREGVEKMLAEIIAWVLENWSDFLPQQVIDFLLSIIG